MEPVIIVLSQTIINVHTQKMWYILFLVVFSVFNRLLKKELGRKL